MRASCTYIRLCTHGVALIRWCCRSLSRSRRTPGSGSVMGAFLVRFWGPSERGCLQGMGGRPPDQVRTRFLVILGSFCCGRALTPKQRCILPYSAGVHAYPYRIPGATHRSSLRRGHGACERGLLAGAARRRPCADGLWRGGNFLQFMMPCPNSAQCVLATVICRVRTVARGV